MILVFVFFVLIAQSSASFFSEFTQALGSIESKVGKLITDVGSDLRDTYDCAVDAVEEVIYDKDQISKYYDKCKDNNTKSNTVPIVKDAPQTIRIYVKPIETGTSKNDITIKTNYAITDHGPKDFDKKLSSVERIVNNEYYRVDNMSSHLEHEFEGLSKNVDEKLSMIEKEKEDLQKTLLEIKNLHIQEEIEIERTKDEIRKAFYEILKKINSSTKESDLNFEMNAAMADIEKNSSKTILEEIVKWKERGIGHLKVLQNVETSQSSTESNMPRTFKELAAKISRDTTTNNLEVSMTESSTVDTTTYFPSTTKKLSPIASVSAQSTTTASISSTPSSIFSEPVITSIINNTIYSTEPNTRPLRVTTISSAVPVTIAADTVTQTSTLTSTSAEPLTTTFVTNSMTRDSTVTTTLSAEPIITTFITEPVTQSSTVTTSTSTEPITLSAEPITTTSTTESVSRASTVNTSTSVEPLTTTSTTKPVTRSSTVMTSISTEPVTQISTVTTSTSAEPLTATSTTEAMTRMSTIITSTSTESLAKTSATELVTQISKVTSGFSAEPLTTTYTSKPVTHVSTVTTNTSAESLTTTSTTESATRALTTNFSTEPAITTYTEPLTRSPTVRTTIDPVTRAPTVIITTSAELLTGFSTVATNTYIEPVTRVSTETSTTAIKPVITLASIFTTSISAEPQTQASIITNYNAQQVTQALFPEKTGIVARATTSRKPVTLPTFVNKIPLKQSIRPRRNNRFGYTTPNYPIKIASSTLRPSNNVDKQSHKNPIAAVAEALKIFSNSIKTKSVLDKFFKNSVPARRPF